MKVLLVYAHPEPRSLNGALRDFAVAHLQAAGHEVQVSDLYALHWKATLDAADAPHLALGHASMRSWILGRPMPPASNRRISPPSRPSCCGPMC